MRVLVAGAGYVGTELLHLLRQSGHDVWGIRRSREEPKLSVMKADASTGAGFDQLPPSFDQIVICISPGERSDTAYERAYQGAVRFLSERYPEGRICLVSSTSVYAQDDGAIITEESATSRSSFRATRILEAEDALFARGKGSLIVRASGIYGPNRLSMMARLAHCELAPQDQTVWTNRIHRDDLARALFHLIQSSETSGVYLASDEHPATLGEMRVWILGHPFRKRLPAQKGASRRERSSRRILPTRLKESGFDFKYPGFRDGYAALLSGLGSQQAPAEKPLPPHPLR